LSIVLGAFLVLAQFSGILFLNNSAVLAQETKSALFRGYRTGYSDGYMAGYRDFTAKVERNYQKNKDYVNASRAYSKAYGTLEDYRDGYQQGFSTGYNSAFDRREFDSTVPINLQRRGATSSGSSAKPNPSTDSGYEPEPEASVKPRISPVSSRNNSANQRAESQSIPIPSEPIIIIPANTEIIVELLSGVTTKDGRRGDTFQSRIVAPYEIEGAIVEGRVEELSKPGRIKRRAELRLSFDRIVLSDKRWSNMNAMVVEALPNEANPKNNVKKIDGEGVVQGKSSFKNDVIVVGTTTTTGLTVGAITAGPVGAAVGAAVGGAFGLGGVLVARGKDINLTQGQRLRIRTGYETQIR
jgi:hypothetical protein